MSVMTKADAKKFMEMEDRMIDILDYLHAKNIMNADDHRGILLGGYFRLVEFLKKKGHLNARQAKEALQDGFDSLITSLSV
ncbi:MAG: hypothetical protein FJ119_12620 [Deltaproteobacteria bacterium]|nr:hypothetical protein [Deltaproteobacteria bacterium]